MPSQPNAESAPPPRESTLPLEIQQELLQHRVFDAAISRLWKIWTVLIAIVVIGLAYIGLDLKTKTLKAEEDFQRNTKRIADDAKAQVDHLEDQKRLLSGRLSEIESEIRNSKGQAELSRNELQQQSQKFDSLQKSFLTAFGDSRFDAGRLRATLESAEDTRKATELTKLEVLEAARRAEEQFKASSQRAAALQEESERQASALKDTVTAQLAQGEAASGRAFASRLAALSAEINQKVAAADKLRVVTLVENSDNNRIQIDTGVDQKVFLLSVGAHVARSRTIQAMKLGKPGDLPVVCRNMREKDHLKFTFDDVRVTIKRRSTANIRLLFVEILVFDVTWEPLAGRASEPACEISAN